MVGIEVTHSYYLLGANFSHCIDENVTRLNKQNSFSKHFL